MICALISDIHGNLEALTAVMEDINRNPSVDDVVFLGDAVGYGANPNEVLKVIQSRCKIKIMGNHDYSALGLIDSGDFNDYARDAINFTSSVLSQESRGIISSFQISAAVRDMMLVHSTPERPDLWDYCLSEAVADRQFDYFDQRVCFIGHSHQPLMFRREAHSYAEKIPAMDTPLQPRSRYIVNVGSVGQPRDGDPRACYVIYDTIAQKVQFCRVGYDIYLSQEKMRKAALPSFLIERLRTGR